jgi:alginate O-acetyltransferase complex protein AlgI
MLGYKLVQNFDMPYVANSIADFWRRWHISLSTWLRDYVFFPLGGSRHGTLATCRNLLITMTLCGLWHGANWNFVLFGVVMGLLLSGHRLFGMLTASWPGLRRVLASRAANPVCIVLTFVIFCLSLVVFRSISVANVGVMYARMFSWAPGNGPILHAFGLGLVYALVFGGYFAARGLRLKHLQWKMPAPLAGVSYAVALSFILLLAPTSGQAFIYFQF